jgi:hypothetical protein
MARCIAGSQAMGLLGECSYHFESKLATNNAAKVGIKDSPPVDDLIVIMQP